MNRRLLVLLTSLSIIAVIALCFCFEFSPPEFSRQTGVYDEAFTLKIRAGGIGNTVRYTLDGSLPTADSPIFPRGGMIISDRSDKPNQLADIPTNQFTLETDHQAKRVTKGTVIRAATFSANGKKMSSVVTETYLVGLDYKDIKIVSLVLDSDSLFDYETGIYVMGKTYYDWMKSDPDAINAETWEIKGNFSQKGREWEREVLMQLIEKDGRVGLEQTLGMRIMGAATRTYYQKSFRLTAREEYGSSHVEYPLIDGVVNADGQPMKKYKSFLLRNGGNDNGYTLLRDPYIQALLPDRDFSTQGAEPAIVFINGEYWGVYCITEDYTDNYIQEHFGIDNTNVIIVKNSRVDSGTEADFKLYEELEGSFYSRDFSNQEDYEWFCEKVDLQSFIDYMAVQIYIANDDGIYVGNNWRIWRARETDPNNEYADGKWRFMLYDTDFGFGLYSDSKNAPKKNTVSTVLGTDWGWSLLFNKLMKNEDFSRQFINTFMDLRNTNFDYKNALQTLNEIKKPYAPYMPEQYERNGPGWAIMWSDLNTRFESELDIVESFAFGRGDYSILMLKRGYNLGEEYTVTLDTNNAAGGTVTVNTVTPDLGEGKWDGEYFSDYEITLTANPARGYVFAGWSGDVSSEQPELTLRLTKNTKITANFERR